MRKWILCLILCAVVPSICEARGRIFGRRGGYSTGYSAPAIPAGHSTATCAGVARIMAALGRVGHFGGNSGYEGCASASSQQAAYNNCCYANAGLTTVDVGYAQSASGQWFCCRRYR